jgi:hypothetical protein
MKMTQIHINNGIATRILSREDGSQVRITAQKFFGLGLTCSMDVYVHRRDTPDHPWVLCNDRPHKDWRQMSVDQYVREGRSEMLQAVTHGEILSVTQALWSPDDGLVPDSSTAPSRPRMRG